jgi:hypothetical protein
LRKALDAKFPQPSTKDKLRKTYGKNSAEAQQALREKNLGLFGSKTAKLTYKMASEEEKTYLRTICDFFEAKDGHDCVKLTLPNGEQIISHGIIQPTSLLGTKSFKKNSYNT